MKIELEQVKPADTLKERFTHLLILIMLITCAFQKMLLARHWKALKTEPA